MEATGLVKKIDEDSAIVEISEPGDLDQFPQGADGSIRNNGEISVLNFANASVGQRVSIAAKPYSYLKGSLLVYGLPSLALILGAVSSGWILTPFFPGVDHDILSASGGFSFFIIVFLLLRIVLKQREGKGKVCLVIEEIIEE